jgi:hypothetical protein
MYTHIVKRTLAVGLMAATAAFPAGAQAFHPEDALSGAQVPVTAPQLVSQTQAAPTAQSGGSSFQWGDAGLGAASILALLGVGAGTAAMTRNKRRHDLVGG